MSDKIVIPKIIHYCWFGGKSLPQSTLKCIESWKKFMPDYKIVRWDETNFDINISNYTREAYRNKLYAFVSDYARFWILNNYGGVYLDTDVEVIKPLDGIVGQGPYLGIECEDKINPGLGMAAYPGMPFIRELLDYYDRLSFLHEDGTINYDTVVFHTTNLLYKKGWTGEQKNIAGFTIYSKEFFCPMDYETGKLSLTDKTHTIHHYSATWITPGQRLYKKVEKMFGKNIASMCSKLYKLFK